MALAAKDVQCTAPSRLESAVRMNTASRLASAREKRATVHKALRISELRSTTLRGSLSTASPSAGESRSAGSSAPKASSEYCAMELVDLYAHTRMANLATSEPMRDRNWLASSASSVALGGHVAALSLLIVGCVVEWLSPL